MPKTALVRSRVPNSSMTRPRRGIRALSIWSMVRPGLLASRKAWLIGAPGVKPLPALAGTVPGMVQLPPPVALRFADVLWVALRLGLVQPMVSKPVLCTLVSVTATPPSTPQWFQVLLASSEYLSPQPSALEFLVPLTE